MPLQNRVDPFGAIHAAPQRGLFTGNRGVIHDPDTKTLLKRRWTTKAWIICRCDFRGRTRDVMGHTAPSGRAGWTELFFLDEVTALAAGHRPCFYCRREEALEFARCFAAAQGQLSMRAPAIDAILHGERRASRARHFPVDTADLAWLPDGAMVSIAGQPFARCGTQLLPWSFEGYGAGRTASAHSTAQAAPITPSSTLAALASGYRAAWHKSALTTEEAADA